MLTNTGLSTMRPIYHDGVDNKAVTAMVRPPMIIVCGSLSRPAIAQAPLHESRGGGVEEVKPHGCFQMVQIGPLFGDRSEGIHTKINNKYNMLVNFSRK